MKKQQEEQKKRKQYKKGLPADYGEATPEQVAAAFLRYRPKPKQKC